MKLKNELLFILDQLRSNDEETNLLGIDLLISSRFYFFIKNYSIKFNDLKFTIETIIHCIHDPRFEKIKTQLIQDLIDGLQVLSANWFKLIILNSKYFLYEKTKILFR